MVLPLGRKNARKCTGPFRRFVVVSAPRRADPPYRSARMRHHCPCRLRSPRTRFLRHVHGDGQQAPARHQDHQRRASASNLATFDQALLCPSTPSRSNPIGPERRVPATLGRSVRSTTLGPRERRRPSQPRPRLDRSRIRRHTPFLPELSRSLCRLATPCPTSTEVRTTYRRSVWPRPESRLGRLSC